MLLAPPQLTDLAVIILDGSRDYIVKPFSLMALGGKNLLVNGKWGDIFRKVGTLDYLISGSGSIVITGHGALYRLVLNPNEKFLVSPK